MIIIVPTGLKFYLYLSCCNYGTVVFPTVMQEDTRA